MESALAAHSTRSACSLAAIGLPCPLVLAVVFGLAGVPGLGLRDLLLEPLRQYLALTSSMCFKGLLLGGVLLANRVDHGTRRLCAQLVLLVSRQAPALRVEIVLEL